MNAAVQRETNAKRNIEDIYPGNPKRNLGTISGEMLDLSSNSQILQSYTE
jgi:hypothetical protein